MSAYLKSKPLSYSLSTSLSILVYITSLTPSSVGAQTLANGSSAPIVIERLSVVANRDLVQSGIASNTAREVIDMSDLSSKPARVADVLAQLPGVSLNGQGGLWQAYSVRGFSRWRVQSQVAGIPINTERRAGNALSFIDPNLLQTVEVVKGPASSFYGSGALGGVVNLSPLINAGTEMGASFDSFADEKGIFATTSIDKHSIGAAYREADNDELADGSASYSQYQQFSAYWNGEFILEDELHLRAMFIPSLGKDIGKSNADYPDSRITLYPEEKHLLTKLELVASQLWALGVYGHHQDWQTNVLRQGKRRNLVDYQSFDWGVNSQIFWELDGWQGRLGADFNRRQGVKVDEEQYELSGELAWQRTNLDADEENVAVYADAQIASEHWTWHSGMRFDYYRQISSGNRRTDDKFTGFSSLTYEKDHWQVSAKLGTGFRFPALSESYYSGTTGRGDVVGNPELQPETATNLDLGILWQQGELSWSVNGYSIWAKNYIERLQVADGILSYRNTESGRILGLESSFEWELTQDLSLLWTYQWQKGENEQDQPLADIAPAEHVIALDYQKDDWQGSVRYRNRREKEGFANGEKALASLHLIDMSVKYQVNLDWLLDMTIQNLTDEVYHSTADDLATVMPGRHARLGVTYQY